jgi:hypothetical protein
LVTVWSRAASGGPEHVIPSLGRLTLEFGPLAVFGSWRVTRPATSTRLAAHAPGVAGQVVVGAAQAEQQN